MSYSIDQLKTAVKLAECWTDVCRSLNITVCTFNFKRIQKLCFENKISFNHFNIKRAMRRGKKEWMVDDVYTINSKFARCSLRRRVIKDNFIDYKCSKCFNDGTWYNEKLTLEIEHINGINDDNRKENLTWLCPNCHSQTSTFRNSSNRKRVYELSTKNS